MEGKQYDEFSFSFGSNILTVKSLKAFPIRTNANYMLTVSTKDHAVPCYSLAEFENCGDEQDEYTEVNTEFSMDNFPF